MTDVTDYLRALTGIEPKARVRALDRKVKTPSYSSFSALLEITEDCLAQVTNPNTPEQRRQRFYEILAGTYFRRCSSLGISDLSALESLEEISAKTGTLEYCDRFRSKRAEESERLRVSRN
ncbi:MAG: hypothetical protein PHF67_04675 [Candidatus Nanoarchaeia archaeon]|nr:hypothetical protein [Candidatus Nanoarchaeia archaeon]